MLAVIAAICVIAVLLMAFLWSEKERQISEVDPNTLCPVSTGPIGMIAILVDVTDPLTLTQYSKLQAWLAKSINDAPRGTQFTLGIVSDNSEKWGTKTALCKPQDAGSADGFTQNAKLIGSRYKSDFLDPLEAQLANMVRASGAKQSPIMESLQTLIAQTPGFVTFSGPRRIILISDLLQHSSVLSFYRGDDWESFSSSAAFQRMGHSLLEAEIEIYQVPRPGEGVKRPEILEDFWLRYFDIQGAHLPKVKRLGDL